MNSTVAPPIEKAAVSDAQDVARQFVASPRDGCGRMVGRCVDIFRKTRRAGVNWYPIQRIRLMKTRIEIGGETLDETPHDITMAVS